MKKINEKKKSETRSSGQRARLPTNFFYGPQLKQIKNGQRKKVVERITYEHISQGSCCPKKANNSKSKSHK